MSNKLVKSKKKNTVSKYNGIDKNKKSIIVCLVVSFVISPAIERNILQFKLYLQVSEYMV